MQRPNDDIREAAKKANVHLWRVAKELGIVDTTFSRWLRVEISTETKDRIKEIIKALSQGAA